MMRFPPLSARAWREAWAQAALQVALQVAEALVAMALIALILASQRSFAQDGTASTAQLTVQRFAFAGNSRIDAATLSAALAPWVGRSMTLAQLGDAVDAVTQLYRRRGYPLALAWLPVQTSTDGSITIGVLEGQLNLIQLAWRDESDASDTPDTPAHAARAAALRQHLESHLQRGSVIETARLDRALLLAEEIYNLSLVPTFATGQVQGSADVIVEASATGRRPPRQWSALFDNHGSAGAGRERLSLRLDALDLAGHGDALGLQATLTRGKQTLLGQAHYSVPLGRDGLRAGGSISQMRYAVGDDFAVLAIQGTARVVEAGLSYPYVRAHDRNLSGRIAWQVKQAESTLHGAPLQASEIGGLLLTASGDWRGFDHAGAAQASLFVAHHDLGDVDQRQTDQSEAGFRTIGRFAKLSLEAQATQRLTPLSTLLVRGAAQWASRNLNAVEKFSLGGPDRVRGHAPGEVSGDVGLTFSTELVLPWPPSLPAWGRPVPSLFFDYGRIKRNRVPANASIDDRQHAALQSLQGAGLGLKLGDDERWSLRADLARPIAADTVADGKTWRLWLRSSLRY